MANAQVHDWKSTNRLLECLPQEACDRLHGHLQRVPLEAGKVLFESTSRQGHVYFPRSGVISLLYVMDNGDTGEIAMVGNEGAVGVTVVVDSTTTPTRAQVQVPGEAWMLKSEAVENEFKSGGAFQQLMLRYTQFLLGQMAQAVLCSRHHTMDRQLCRWLLLAFDRAHEDQLLLTQESIAHALGVRREAVSEAASRLQEAGVIRYARGDIRLLDRAALEQHSCSCYQAVRQEEARMMQRLAAL